MPPTTLLLTKPAGSLFCAHLKLHSASLFLFLQGMPPGSVPFKNCTAFLIVQLFLKLYVSSKKEQPNDKTQETEEFKHML